MPCPKIALHVRAWSICLVALLSGCALNAKKAHSLRYDADADTFQVLTVYAHIHGAAKDHAWLAQLWTDRERLIFPATWLALFEEPAYLRLSGGEYRRINLSQRDKTAQPAERPAVPLDKITITPGEFFLSPEKTLCYYHRLNVPGEVVDALLRQEGKSLVEGLTENAEKEIARRKAGGKKLPWAPVRRRLVDASARFGEPDPPVKSEKQKAKSNDDLDPWLALDEASLDLLRGLPSQGAPVCWREKGTLHAGVPLSAADCREAKDTFDAAKHTLLQRAKRQRDHADAESKRAAALQVAIEAVGLEVQEVGGGRTRIVASVDVNRLSRADLSAIGDGEWERPDADQARGYEQTVAAIRQRKIPIREDVELGRLLRDFAAPAKEASKN